MVVSPKFSRRDHSEDPLACIRFLAVLHPAYFAPLFKSIKPCERREPVNSRKLKISVSMQSRRLMTNGSLPLLSRSILKLKPLVHPESALAISRTSFDQYVCSPFLSNIPTTVGCVSNGPFVSLPYVIEFYVVTRRLCSF